MLARLAAAALVALMLLTTPVARGGATAPAQAGPRLEITVYGITVRWWGSAVGTVVRAELRGPGGLKASAETRGIPSVFYFATEDSDVDARILPGDKVTILPEDGPPVTVDVPRLLADVDATRDVVAGVAAPGASIDVLRNLDEPLGRVIAGTDGAFALDLTGQRDLVPGDVGLVQLAAPDDVVFISWWEVTSVELWPDARRIELRTSLGSTLTLEVQPPGGALRTIALTPTRSSTYLKNWYDDGPPLVAGTRVTVTQRSAIPGMGHAWAGTMPDFDLRLDRQSDAIRGHGPPGSTLRVRAAVYSEAQHQRWALDEVVVPDAAGRFVLDLAGRVELRPGWVAELRYEADSAVTVIRQDVLRQFNLALFGYAMDMVVGPRRPVTVTLTSAEGTLLARQVTSSSIDGEASIWYGDYPFSSSGASIEPGTVITVDEYSEGDPIVVQVPPLTIRTDPETDRVSGEAPAGYEIVATTRDGAVQRQATWDNGRYVVDFTGAFDVSAGTSGSVVFSEHSGPFAFYGGWCAPLLDVMLGVANSDNTGGDGAFVRGRGSPGRAVRVRWYAPDGRLVSTATAKVAPGNVSEVGILGGWTTNLPDSLGVTQAMLPGDRFVVEVGDDRLEIVAPELTIQADVAADEMFGRAPPGIPLGVGVMHRLQDSDLRSWSTTVDSMGSYRVAVGPAYDLLHRDRLSASFRLPAGHTIARYSEAPGMLLDLSEGTVHSVTLPGAQVIATLDSPAGRHLTATGRSQANGEVTVAYTDQHGEPVIPTAGDVVTLTATTTDANESLSLTVPELTIQPDPLQNVIAGRATPGGHLEVQVAGALFPLEGIDGPGSDGYATPIVEGDGTWRALATEFCCAGGPTPVKLRPGTKVRALYRLPDGNQVQLSQHLPIVNAEYGGARVCGAAPAHSPVVATLLDAGGVELARAAGRTGRDQRFELHLQRPDGRPLATQTGQAVRVTMGKEVIDVVLPTLSLHVDWDATIPSYGRPATRVSGVGPTLRRTYVIAPALDCFSGSPPAIDIRFYGSENGVDPAFDEVLAHQSGGGGLQVAFYTNDYHRFFRQATRAQARIYVDTDRVAGRATPLQPVTLTLRTGAGAEISNATTAADADGFIDQRLIDERHAPVIIRAGDRLRLQAADGTSDIVVEPLTFDFGVTGGLIGVTRANAAVRLALTLADASTRRFERQAAADGRFRFGPADVPAREGWSLAEVAAIEAVLPLPGGHEVVAEVAMGRRRVEPVFLPFALGLRRR